MKFLLAFALCSVLVVTGSWKPLPVAHDFAAEWNYDPSYVSISDVTYKNEQYITVTMRREGERIRAKYFAAPDFNGNSVYKRFEEWKRRNNNLVLVSSGTYMDDANTPEGLTIDNGILVNQTLIYNKMDALAIVYATGGIAVSNLKNGDLKLSGGGVDPNRKFNLRGSALDREDFIEWAKSQEATIFPNPPARVRRPA